MSIPYLVGAFFGGCLIIALFTAIVEAAGGRRIKELTPGPRAVISVGIAWLLTGTLAMFSMADGGPLYLPAFLIYLPSAFVVALYQRNRLQKMWVADQVETTFE